MVGRVVDTAPTAVARFYVVRLENAPIPHPEKVHYFSFFSVTSSMVFFARANDAARDVVE